MKVCNHIAQRRRRGGRMRWKWRGAVKKCVCPLKAARIANPAFSARFQKQRYLARTPSHSPFPPRKPRGYMERNVSRHWETAPPPSAYGYTTFSLFFFSPTVFLFVAAAIPAGWPSSDGVVTVYVLHISQPNLTTLFSVFLSLLSFQLYFIPWIPPTTLRFLTIFFRSYFCLTGPFNSISLYESLPQPWALM